MLKSCQKIEYNGWGKQKWKQNPRFNHAFKELFCKKVGGSFLFLSEVSIFQNESSKPSEIWPRLMEPFHPLLIHFCLRLLFRQSNFGSLEANVLHTLLTKTPHPFINLSHSPPPPAPIWKFLRFKIFAFSFTKES